MKKKETASPPLLGGSSLLAIFGVLCLTVFSLLSLTSVSASQRLSDSALSAVTAYYQADKAAEVIFARLRNGEIPPEVEQEGAIYRYECPITAGRSLFVELQREEDGWLVLRWQEVAQPIPIDETMPVWNGE